MFGNQEFKARLSTGQVARLIAETHYNQNLAVLYAHCVLSVELGIGGIPWGIVLTEAYTPEVSLVEKIDYSSKIS